MELSALISAAWIAYSTDSRLAVTMPGGQAAPDDYGAFMEALVLAGNPTGADIRHYVNRAYRHFQNEHLLAGKAKETAFAEGIRLAVNELEVL